MKPPMLRAALLLGTIATVVVTRGRAQSSSTVDGKILRIECDAQIKKSGASGWQGLKGPVAIGLPLMDGDIVECAGKGYLEILLPEGKKVLTHEMGQFPIKAVLDPPYPQIVQAIKRIGVSGATRGNASDARVHWPAENSVIVPEHFEVRWTSVSRKLTLAILSEAKDVTVWGPAEADGASGSLKSEAAAAALQAYKKKSANPRLVLTVTFGEPSDWEEVHFSLIAGRQEQELNAQLDFWAKHSEDLALHLGRGYSFQRYQVFAEAADEYESALKSAPDSPYLLQDAMEADRLAGRPARVKELQDRLASASRTENR